MSLVWWRESWAGRTVVASRPLVLWVAAVSAGHLLAAAELQPLRLGVVSLDSPRVIYGRFQPLLDHLSQRTGHPFELRLRPSYDAMLDDLCSSRVEFAYLGPFSYLRAHARCGAIPLMRQVRAGRPTYRSYILVRSDSRFGSLPELRGCRLGFGDPLSTSAHLVPRAVLGAAGIDPDRDLRCRYYDHHDLAARAVLLGEVDACAVRDAVAERFLERDLRALFRSEPIPAFPIAAAPTAPARLRAEVSDALAAYPGLPANEDPADEGERLGTFVPVEDEDYDEVRALAERVFGPDALDRPAAMLRCGEEAR
jgi:phosphonate transport system substrate-binding protein